MAARRIAVVVIFIGLLVVSGAAMAAVASDMPNRALTPGRAATTKKALVCQPRWVTAHRYVSPATTKKVFARYHLRDIRGAYEVDHLIPVELGGSNDIRNLWPEPYAGVDGARVKDRLEIRLRGLVCTGHLSLVSAQKQIAANWKAAYRRYVGPLPSTAAPSGNDISYPQCGGSFPSSPAFEIVGVNDGLANNLNPCFGPSSTYPRYTQSELYWAAATATGLTVQPKASLYVNTADPGNVDNGTPIADWPASGGNAAYGSCTTTTVTTTSGTASVGQDSLACAWQYGYNKAQQDALWLSNAASAIDSQTPPTTVLGTAPSYPWWFDVEAASSWQTGSGGQAMNVADLQGMIAGLQAAGATKFGVYSTASEWTSITGGTSPGSLSGAPDWIPGATTLMGAQSNCKLKSFTGGKVSITQWSGRVDSDYACD